MNALLTLIILDRIRTAAFARFFLAQVVNVTRTSARVSEEMLVDGSSQQGAGDDNKLSTVYILAVDLVDGNLVAMC